MQAKFVLILPLSLRKYKNPKEQIENVKWNNIYAKHQAPQEHNVQKNKKNHISTT